MKLSSDIASPVGHRLVRAHYTIAVGRMAKSISTAQVRAMINDGRNVEWEEINQPVPRDFEALQKLGRLR